MFGASWKTSRVAGLCGAAVLTIANLAQAQSILPTVPAPPQAVAKAPELGQPQSATSTSLSRPSAAAPGTLAPVPAAANQDDLKARIDRLEKQNQDLLTALKSLQKDAAKAATTPTSVPAPAAPANTLSPTDVRAIINNYYAEKEAQHKTDAQNKGGDGYAVPSADGAGLPPAFTVSPFPHIDFTNGLFFQSEDKQFSMRFNNLTQTDYRNFSQPAGSHTPTSLNDNFTLAREWLFFRGNATEFMDYTVIIAAGAAASPTGPSTVNILDTYVDFNPFGAENKEYLQVRIGRFKTPFLYQFYKQAPQDFVAPELSMFSTNFLQNRQIGIMAHGELAEKRIDYAAGVFNGAPNSFETEQSNREGIFFLGLSPFRNEDTFLKKLVLAGSYATGVQNGAAFPANFGTAVPSGGPPNNDLISPTFLTFSPTTIQTGYHDSYALDLLYTYKVFNFYGEYNGAHQSYALAATPGVSTPVSVTGYSAALTCFFTGEEIETSRSRVQPLRPYNFGCGDRGFGAFEGFARYSALNLSNNVLNNGLVVGGAAANANAVHASDIGVNWYLNQYIKFTLDWQHAMFNNDISLAPGVAGARTARTEDLAWLRFQLYY